MNLHTVKWPSETKSNPENCSSKCAYDCADLQYTTQNSSDNLSSYSRKTIIAEMLSIGGEGVVIKVKTQFIQKCSSTM